MSQLPALMLEFQSPLTVSESALQASVPTHFKDRHSNEMGPSPQQSLCSGSPYHVVEVIAKVG